MQLNSDILTTILTFLGIQNLHIHFDSTNERIDAAYDQHGQPHEKKITFKEIEAMFSDKDSTHEKGAATLDLNPEGGYELSK